MNHQAGVSSTWHPMPHDHSNVNQGGAVPILSISGYLEATRVVGSDTQHPSYYLYEGVTQRGTLRYDKTNHRILLATVSENADIFLLPHGTGKVRFGTRVGLSGETVTGYINIIDQAGNARKLAVVS